MPGSFSTLPNSSYRRDDFGHRPPTHSNKKMRSFLSPPMPLAVAAQQGTRDLPNLSHGALLNYNRPRPRVDTAG
ncbi:uncharacterized protein K460DRAFT_370277 [Cucurbitaria berberidis CBS 394.84]|uniref:Uncharacterized protein n=1 Tax=Cucurbitaria berberidis CBS 394.84 TaxID=1168544 RepID=A0A9P4L567_9PLEO|nr:uncharacterized protein K460DRAFT_370277 [Cucurbitaria berberidis CBS 394.84]KAF1842300.1 hypothetical protein K460DRAFT_370277 [Cucurbitaria berberidis CBS 394.84]